ncbi:MAG: hypothetical protein CFE43_14225 [Burkholderiales bacterium PBB3]|nr:MAG: hypothetical protein CFE43_14225 [Burkholderiales bacterium PBB3]
MKKIWLSGLLGAMGWMLCVGGAAQAETLTLERIYGEPPLEGRQPRQTVVSPGSGWLSYLRPAAQDSEVLELWMQPSSGGAARKVVAAADLLAGRAQQLTEAEKMALERKRISQRGITSYQWCGDGDTALLFPLSGDLYLATLGPTGVVTQRLTHDEAVPERDPMCAPDGKQVAYVKDGNLWVQSLVGDAGAVARQLTTDATALVQYGLAEFIAAEELDRQRGFWWSPDGQSILVLKVDESPVPVKVRAQIFAGRVAMTEQRYPAAGEANAKVTAWTIHVKSAARQALPLPAQAEYISRAGWFKDGTPWLQWFTRDQTQLTLTEYTSSTSTGATTARTVLTEQDPAWVDSHSDLTELPGLVLSGQPALLWSSEASGRRQLQLVDRVSGARRALTAQPEAVTGVVCASGNEVVFTGATERGRGQELFVAAVDGSTRPLGGAAAQQWRSATGDKACKTLLVQQSAWAQPSRMELRGLSDLSPVIALPGEAPSALLISVVPVPQALDLLAADGKTLLNAFYLPPLKPGAAPGQMHPVLTLAYGGPSGQTVAWRWNRSNAMLAYWQRRGFGVLMVDTRGMAHRDRAFTRAHYRSVGQVEVDDLYAAVRQLPAKVPGVDPARVGFFGWSYGGFLAARVMLDTDTPFAAAIGVAPVTDWTLYDTAYTERYLGMPLGTDGKPSAAYRHADLTLRAAQLTKPLLLVHGTADDNVLFDHSLKLVEALQNEGKLFDLMIYPGKAHGIAGRKTSLHLYRTLDAFLVRHLQP